MTENLPADEVDADFRSLTLSLSTPLPRPLEPEDKVPVEKSVADAPIGKSGGDNNPRYPGGSTAAGRRKPRYSGSLFPKKQPPVT